MINLVGDLTWENISAFYFETFLTPQHNFDWGKKGVWFVGLTNGVS